MVSRSHGVVRIWAGSLPRCYLQRHSAEPGSDSGADRPHRGQVLREDKGRQVKSRSDIQPNEVGAKPIVRKFYDAETLAQCCEFMMTETGSRKLAHTMQAAADFIRAHAAPSPQGVGLDECVRTYASGDRIVEKHSGNDTLRWLEYNLTFRPGCRVEVNGIVFANGYVGPSEPEGGG